MGRPRKKDTKLPAYVRIRFGSYLYKDKKLCRADAGESAMYEALAKLLKGLDISTVPAAVAIFKLEYLPTLKASSRTEHAALLDIFADEFEDFRVDQVRAHHIKAACKARFPDAPTRARHFKSRVSTFFRWCIADKGMVQINPCKDVWLEKPVTRKTPWTPALFWAVRDHLTPMYQCYHDLSYLLYQRTTDVRWLLKEQVRESEGVIHFEPTKTARSSGRAVDIPITPAIKAVLDRAKELSREITKKKGVISKYVLQTRSGSPYTRSAIHSAYRRADEKLHGKDDFRNLNPKALRPFAATQAKKAGATLEALREGLAHTTVATTEGYIQSHEVPVSTIRMTLPERQKQD